MDMSLVPWRSNSLGMERSTMSGSDLSAPSFASASASSLPWEPLWPFTHLKEVVAMCCLRIAAAFLK